MTTTLLPAGFHDIVPPYAEARSKLVAKLLKICSRWGYQQVISPLGEFVDLENRQEVEQQLKFVDPESNDIVGIRADITPQIGRIAALRMQDEPRPLRFSYAGDVLRAKSKELYTERELTQVGAELIGSDVLEADLEALERGLEALTSLGLKGLSVDFTLPQLFNEIVNEYGVGDSEAAELARAIQHKDRRQVLVTRSKASELIAELLDLSGTADTVLGKLTTLKLPKTSAAQCKDIATLCKKLQKRFGEVKLTVDLLDNQGFDYYTGVAFSFFISGRVEELGRGGRYNVSYSDEPATGFALNINALQRALPNPKPSKRIYAVAGEDPSELRAKGEIVIQGLPGEKDQQAAKALGCDRILKQGKLSEI